MPFDPYRPASDPDAVELPPHADAVLDSAQSVSRHLYDMQRLIEDLISVVDRKADAVLDDAGGFTRHHVRSWQAIEAQTAAAGDALVALDKLARAA